MDINVVSDPDEISEIIPVIKSAWGMEKMDQLVKDIVASMRFHGGLVLLARESGNVVGMHYSFPGYRNGRVYLYSHMTGVIQDLKYSGVGKALKLAQRDWASSHGYNLVAWTYDPLMALNANFNFNKLGVFSRTYLRNFYGQMEDSLNFGMPTDRFVAEWWNGYIKPRLPVPGSFANDSAELFASHPDVDSPSIGVYIPGDFVSIKKSDPDLALKIRMGLRETFENLFAKGYNAVGFNREEAYYTFVKDEKIVANYGKNIFRD